MNSLAMHVVVVGVMAILLVNPAFTQRGGLKSRDTAGQKSKASIYQIPGLPPYIESDCQNLRPIEIPVEGGDKYTKISFTTYRAIAFHNMLARLTKDEHPIRYDAGKNELTLKVSEEFGKPGTIKLPLFPSGQGPVNIRVSMMLKGQAERLAVAALIERMPAKGRQAVKIIDAENGNGLEITDQEILKKLDVLRALRAGAPLCHHAHVIFLSIRKSLIRMTASDHPPLEYKINQDADPEKEFYRIIDSFYQLKVTPFLNTKNRIAS